MNTVWLMVMTLVLGVMARSKDPTTSSTEAGGNPNGTSFNTTPYRAAFSLQGWIPPGCSMSDKRISSPGSNSRPLATKFIPSVVFRVRTISSGDAPTNRATLFRTSSRRAPKVLYTSHGVVHWIRKLEVRVLNTGSGMGPTVPLFIMMSPSSKR